MKAETADAPEYWFYHLERQRLQDALPPLLERSLAKGWRALIRSPDVNRLAALDDHLWTYRDEAFLPHGRSGEPNAARQPVLLTAGSDNLNNAEALFLLDNADPEPLAGVARCVIVFEAADEGAVAGARARWKLLKAEGASISYWRQDARGGWEKRG